MSSVQSQNRTLLMDLEQKILFPTTPDDKIFIKYQSIILKQRSLILTDPKTPQILEKIHSRNIKVLLLTNAFAGCYGKISNYEQHLSSELNKLGIDFKIFWKNLDNYIFTKLPHNASKTFKSEKHHPIFYDGMLLTISSDKGTVLNEFLTYSNLKPKKIIFIDNKEKNLKSLQQVLDKSGIDFTGIIYTTDSENLKKANEKTARVQLETLKKEYIWTSDKQAKKLLL